jgi:hypothetical protein
MGTQISYDPGSGAIVLDCSHRGVQNFIATDTGRGNDNLSSSGFRERVLEAVDTLASFTMPALLVADDYQAWAAFYRWAIGGGQFLFKPNYPLSSKSYTVVLEQLDFKPARVGVRRYSISVNLRFVPIGSAPADAGEVMYAFWGLV